ncbi:MAG: hypothetical protein ACJ763_17400 [Bdellovibrionia bacterium]
MRNFKIQLLSFCFLGILAAVCVTVPGVARANESTEYDSQVVDLSKSEVRECLQPGGHGGGGHGGGEVPNPLLTINQHVELAPGEFYSLYGTIVAGSDNPNATSATSVPMFAIDLQQHPWLANVQRARAPYYYLTGGWPFWSRYLQKRVLVTAQARITYVNRPNGERYPEIALQVVDSGSVTPVTSSGVRSVK